MGDNLMFFKSKPEPDPPDSDGGFSLEQSFPETYGRLQRFRLWESGVAKDLEVSPADRVSTKANTKTILY